MPCANRVKAIDYSAVYTKLMKQTLEGAGESEYELILRMLRG